MFDLPDPESPQSVADWIELELAAGEQQLSKVTVSSIIESLTGSEPGEAFLSDVWRQLEERQSRYSRQFFSCDADMPVLADVQADIASRVKDVATLLREKFIEAPAARYKDRGVDVIAWQPFVEHSAGEHRSNQIVILAQCAAGSNWREKTGQLPYQAWIEYVHWACHPVRGFAVPRVIPPELWHDVSKESGG